MKPFRTAIILGAALCAAPALAQGQTVVRQMQLDPSVERAPPPANPQAFQSRLIASVMDVSNRKRAEAGLPPLSWDAPLADAADRYARKMHHFQFFKHTSPAGQTLDERLPQPILQRYTKLGENLWSAQGAVDWRASRLAEEAAANWIESRAHRTNLLEPGFSQAGVGVAFSPERGVFISMMFARPHGAGKPIALPSHAPQDLYGLAKTLPGNILTALNAERAVRGLPALQIDPTLSQVALRHSEGLIDASTFSENDSGGVSVLTRAVDATSGRFRRMALGLWHGHGGLVFEPRAITESVMRTWLGRPGNLDDLLDPRFDLAGLGVATDGNRVLVTALYGESAQSAPASYLAPQPVYSTIPQ